MFKVLIVAAVAVVVTAALVHALFSREAGRRWLLPFLRPLLKVINPRVLRAAARGETKYGVVHHIGRRSGAAYHTPVEAHRTPGGALILLPYGPATDWCRNVLAAGGCTLTLDGKDLPLRAPEVVPAGAAEAQVPETVARRWRREGIAHFLSLQSDPRSDLGAASEGGVGRPTGTRA